MCACVRPMHRNSAGLFVFACSRDATRVSGLCRMTVWNLYMAPRITEPIWLTMVSQSAERNQVCQRFLKEMSLLMEHGSKSQLVHNII